MLSRNTKKNEIRIVDSGVYILILDGIVVYVGESKSVYSRIGAHVKDSKKRFDSVRILPCQEHRRKYWEAVLIDRYQPLFNTKGKDKATNQRHIHRLSKITKRQYKQAVKCENCKKQDTFYLGLSSSSAFAPLEAGTGTTAFPYPVTNATTSAGSIFLETTSTSNVEYIRLAHIEETEKKRIKKKKAWDDTVGYTEKLHHSLDVGFSTSNPYNRPDARHIKIPKDAEIRALESKIEGLRGYEPERAKQIKQRIQQLKKSRKKYVEFTLPPRDERLDVCRDDFYNVSTSITDPESLKSVLSEHKIRPL